jgi:Fe-S cluster biogenesis protein NfuA
MNDDEVTAMVNRYLDKLKPYIQKDGGDIELVNIEDGIVYIKFFGACLHCAQIDVTLKDGIEVLLMENIPQIIGVELVENTELNSKPVNQGNSSDTK